MPKVQGYSFDAQHCIERGDEALDALREWRHTDRVNWIRIQGRPGVLWMRRYGEVLGLHPLAQEDILEGEQRPKMEPYEDHLFVVLNVPVLVHGRVVLRQLYISLHRNHLVTVFEGDRDPFDAIVRRLRQNGHDRLRRSDLDYLFYVLVDVAVDGAFPVLEQLDDQMEVLEENLIVNPDRHALGDIYRLRHDILLLRRSAWPQRETLGRLVREADEWIGETVRVYLRDCLDHAHQIADLLQTLADTSANLLDIYLSSASMRTNEIMRVLTVFATIFMPLTFIVGVYGMNFKYMPELEWRYGYPAVLGVCLVIALGMLIWFRRKGWL
ncbi:magnesium transporter [Methylomarinovum tepidoasis]|uniref:Magnesium transport protein CorA n=1 Tax=Methylomarinovum tepidoasis TaxID=2840183 RepID=A0AAU9CJT0_9GAMM|nr:magnesium/cobalt transporter CorA [Methylomarinovum sp. IN45]BCX89676.1 magnesium transporter [Methylomarinovum sp. IN45]